MDKDLTWKKVVHEAIDKTLMLIGCILAYIVFRLETPAHLHQKPVPFLDCRPVAAAAPVSPAKDK